MRRPLLRMTGLSTTRLASAAAGAVVGAIAWSATEYITHRWVLHGPATQRWSRLPVGSVHRHHHAQPEHTVRSARVAACAAMLGVGAFAGSGLARHLPSVFSRAAGISWGAGYTAYDVVHWRLHHRPPTSPRGVRLRQRHFRHHFGAPRGNLGVTSAVGDRLLGTEVADRPVTVPARHAPVWLDELGPKFTVGPARSSADGA